jgi:hypothetical protein
LTKKTLLAKMLTAQHSLGLMASTPFTTRSFSGANGMRMPSLRRSLRVRADSQNQAKGLVDDLKEKTKDFVEETKKNSGLDERTLGNQPGNDSSPTYATTEIKTPKGEAAEVFSFSGGPGGITSLVELTNGRAAMFAMLAAFGAEVSSRQPIFVQVQQAPVAILATFVTIIVASAIPVFRNANLDQNGAGPFTKEAEVINGRLGMAAFALLILVETWKAGPGLVL